MDPNSHKEFRCSADGAYIAVGLGPCDNSAGPSVCVLRVSDGKRFDLAETPYDCGGHRLAIDSKSRTLFSGAYHHLGIAAYNFESGICRWRRRDLKKLQVIEYDSHSDLAYCAFERRAAKPLNARDGRERRPLRGLKSFHFSRDGDVAVFESHDVTLENRAAGTLHVLHRETWGILDAAFATDAVVLSWVTGPVVSYNAETGKECWRYSTEGTHAFGIRASADQSGVWVVEQPYTEPPCYRVRLLSTGGDIEREFRCSLGHSFAIIPFANKVIRSDMVIAPIESLGHE